MSIPGRKTQHAKELYVATIQVARHAANLFGILDFLERRRDKQAAVWLRSLFAIYDLDDMVHLDLPWWTFTAADLVARFLVLRTKANVFEYGSGSSTIWLSKRAGSVKSVEHDRRWADGLRPYLEPYTNVEVRVIAPSKAIHPTCGSARPEWQGYDFEHYAAAIDEPFESFDLIIIDGRARIDCLKAALSHLRPDGLIVFDDADRSRYRRAILECGLARYDARGLRPGLPYRSTTTLLARDPFVLTCIGADPSD